MHHVQDVPRNIAQIEIFQTLRVSDGTVVVTLAGV
jgi:hypothetical protein